MKYHLKGAIALALAATLPMMAIAQEQAKAPTEAEIQAALAEHDGNEVLATVGKQKVTLADAAMIYTTLPPEVEGAEAEQLLEGITEQLVSETALYQRALEEGLDKNKEMTFRLEAIRRSALAEAYLTSKLDEAITEESLRKQYDALTADFDGAKEVNARHILVKTEDEAKALVKSLKDGADFAELAAEKSTGPSGANGGSLGWFSKDTMVAPFSEAAFALEKGGLSAPVETQFGWHVILVEDIRTQAPPPFETVEPNLRQRASQAAAQDIITKTRESMDIKIEEKTPPAFLIRRSEIYQD